MSERDLAEVFDHDVCQVCRFWWGSPGREVGKCRRHAPRPGDGYGAGWPETSLRDWCGEFAKAEPKEEADF